MLSKLLADPARREWAGMGVRTLAKFDFEGPTSPNRSSSSFWRAEISSSSLLIISALRLALWPALPRGAPGSARGRGKCGSEWGWDPATLYCPRGKKPSEPVPRALPAGPGRPREPRLALLRLRGRVVAPVAQAKTLTPTRASDSLLPSRLLFP